MEVFIRDVPEQVTENGIRKVLQPYVDKLSIQTYHCRKQRQKRFALLTFLHQSDGQRFLVMYGQFKPSKFSNEPPKVRLLGTPVYCSVSNNSVNPHLLRSLEKEERDRSAQSKKPVKQKKAIPETARSFVCSSVSVRLRSLFAAFRKLFSITRCFLDLKV